MFATKNTEFKILGGGLYRPGKVLQQSWDKNWYPVCDNFDDEESRNLFGDMVCQQIGFAKELSKPAREFEKDSCPQCWRDFDIVGISCSNDGNVKCDYKYSHFSGSGTCIKGKSDLYIQCKKPLSLNGEWTPWSEWTYCDETGSDYFKQRSRTCYDDGKRAICPEGESDFELKPDCLCEKANEIADYNKDYYSDSSSSSYDYSYGSPSGSSDIKASSPDDMSLYSSSYDYYRRKRRAASAPFVKPSFCKNYNFQNLYSSKADQSSESPPFVVRKPDADIFTQKTPIVESDSDPPVVTVELSDSVTFPASSDSKPETAAFGSQTVVLIGVAVLGCLILLVIALVKRRKTSNSSGNTLDDERKVPESIGLIQPKTAAH